LLAGGKVLPAAKARGISIEDGTCHGDQCRQV